MCSEQLALDFQSGSLDAFNEVYRLYNGIVRERIKQHIRGGALQSELDDICQKFWMEIYRWGKSYDPTRPLKNWLLVAARRATAGYYRSTAHKHNIRIVPASEMEPPADGEPGPEERAILREEFAAALEALERIPAQFRLAIKAVYLQGVDPLEYARMAGIAEGTIYVQLQRGLRHLQRAI